MSWRLAFIASLMLAVVLGVASCGGSEQEPATPPQQIAQPAPPPSEQPTTPAAADGKTLYEKRCSACHGQGAKGLWGMGKDLTTDSPFMQNMSNDQLLEFIKTGRAADDPANTTGVAMPPKGGNRYFPEFTDEEIKAIITYLRSLK